MALSIALRERLLAALDSPNPLERRHARHRLDDVEPAKPVGGVAETLSQIEAVKRCRFFSRPPGCGCAFGRCSKFDRPTSFRECLDCGEYDSTRPAEADPIGGGAHLWEVGVAVAALGEGRGVAKEPLNHGVSPTPTLSQGREGVAD